MKKIYLSAAMSGKEDFNRKRMCYVADKLRAYFLVHNPGDYDQWPAYCMENTLGDISKDIVLKDKIIHDDFWRFCLRNDKRDLTSGKFDALVLDPIDWEQSRGVMLELIDSSIMMDMPIYEFEDRDTGFNLHTLDIDVSVVTEATGEVKEFKV